MIYKKKELQNMRLNLIKLMKKKTKFKMNLFNCYKKKINKLKNFKKMVLINIILQKNKNLKLINFKILLKIFKINLIHKNKCKAINKIHYNNSIIVNNKQKLLT